MHLHPDALRRSAVFSQNQRGGVLWRSVSWTRSLARIFRWDFLMGFFQGFFCGQTAQKIRRKNPHPKIRTGHQKIREKSAPQNPRKKSAPKNPHQKSAPKNPHEKSTPTCPCKSPNHPHEWNKLQQTSTREGCEQRTPHGVLSLMLGDGHASSIQTTTS